MTLFPLIGCYIFSYVAAFFKYHKQAFYLRHFQWLFALYTTSKHVTCHTSKSVCDILVG